MTRTGNEGRRGSTAPASRSACGSKNNLNLATAEVKGKWGQPHVGAKRCNDGKNVAQNAIKVRGKNDRIYN